MKLLKSFLLATAIVMGVVAISTAVTALFIYFPSVGLSLILLFIFVVVWAGVHESFFD